MRKAAIALTILSLFSAATEAIAAGVMKPGLWEITTKSDGLKTIPNLTAQQKEQMRQAGIDIEQMSAGSMVSKICISKEMAERDQPPLMSTNQTGCVHKNAQRSSTGYSADIVCNGPNMTGSGTVKGTFVGDTFSAVNDFKGSSHGEPVNRHSETTGKYLGSDCGNIKPMLMPGGK